MTEPAITCPSLQNRTAAYRVAQRDAARPREVRTTLDAPLQRTIEGIIAAERPSLAAHHASNVAVVVLDNRSG